MKPLISYILGVLTVLTLGLNWSRTPVNHPTWGVQKIELKPLTKPNASACDSEWETTLYIYSLMNPDQRYGFNVARNSLSRLNIIEQEILPLALSDIDKGVYITRTGTKYHIRSCVYGLGGQCVTLKSAIQCGYEACKVCE